jgi:hypothetical protein
MATFAFPASATWTTPGHMQSVTQVKRALKAALADRLPFFLQRADLDAADGVITPVPYVIYTTEKWELAGFPAIEITVISSRPTQDSHAQVMEHRVPVAFTLTGDDEETLTIQVERYMWAVRQVVRDLLLAPDSLCGPIDVGDETYTPLDNKGTERVFVKGGWVELRVTTVGE